MWIFIVLQLVLLLILVLLLLFGPIVMLVGKCKKNNKMLRLGLKLFMIPILLCASVLLYYLAWKTFAVRPTKADLVGNYIVANPNALNDGKATLRLYENGAFEKSFDFRNVNGQKGKYSLYDDEVWFRCDDHATTGKIVRGFTGFEIKFIVNDRNDNENLIFKKVE